MYPFDLNKINQQGDQVVVIRQNTKLTGGNIQVLSFEYQKLKRGFVLGIAINEISGNASNVNMTITKNGITIINAYNGNMTSIPLMYFEYKFVVLNVELTRKDIIEIRCVSSPPNRQVITELYIQEKGNF